MNDTPTPQNHPQESERISARGWTKIALTVIIGSALLVLMQHDFDAGAQRAYDDQFDSIMNEGGGGNILAAHGEGQIAGLMSPFMTLLFVYGPVALVVQIVISLLWRKKSA